MRVWRGSTRARSDALSAEPVLALTSPKDDFYNTFSSPQLSRESLTDARRHHDYRRWFGRF